jgi:hypothetical protein
MFSNIMLEEPNIDAGQTDLSSQVEKREGGGWPVWEHQADRILNSIRTHVFQPSAIGIVALGQAIVLRGDKYNSYVALHKFLRILDTFLSQLIAWAEQTDPPNRELRKWAGEALADRLQFLLAQQRDWHDKNEGFRKRRAEFGDRRHARLPRSYIAWVAGDYLDAIIKEQVAAYLLLSPPPGEQNGMSTAQLLGYSEERVSWLKKLVALPSFSADSARQWADIVFERMQQDEQKILNTPEMRRCKPRPDIAERRSKTRFIVRSGKLSAKDNKHRRSDAKVRLYDFQSTILGAVLRLASKPVGSIRGITRPGLTFRRQRI